MGKPAEIWLNQVSYILCMFAFVFAIAFFPLLFYTTTAYAPQHTYQLGSPPGTLRTERFSFDFFAIGLYNLIWFIPLTLLFLADRPSNGGRFALHITVLVILFVWFMIIIGFGIYDWANANKTTPSHFDNPANDDRWCCVHFSLPGAPCLNTVACPGVGVNDLGVNGSFLFRMFYTIVLQVVLLLDFIIMMSMVQPAVANYVREQEEEDSDDEEKQQQLQMQQKKPATSRIGKSIMIRK